MSYENCRRTFQHFYTRVLRCLEIWGSDCPFAQCKIPEEINPKPSESPIVSLFRTKRSSDTNTITQKWKNIVSVSIPTIASLQES
jgi:hypothetical protein